MLVDGLDVKAQTFNEAFPSKTDDSEVEGKYTFNDPTNSTAPTNGSVHVKGGVGVEKDVQVGGKIVAAGTLEGSNLSGSNSGDTSFANVGTTPSPKGVTQSGQVFTLQPADSVNPGLMSVAAQSFSGVKTFLNKVFFMNDVEIQGTTTFINTTEMQVKDAYMTLNKGGNDSTAAGAGIEIDGVTGGNAAIQYDSTLASKWKLGKIGAMYEVIVAAGTQSIGGLKTFLSLLTTSDILIDGKLLKGVQVNTQSGTLITVTNPTKPVVAFTNASLVSIASITAPSGSSQGFTAINKTGVTVTLKNGLGIETGTGADLDWANGKALEIIYDPNGTATYRVVGGTGSGGGSFTNIVTKSANATILAAEDCVLVDASAGNIVLTLPAWALKEQHAFKRMDSVETNTVTVTAAGADLIDDVATYTLPFKNTTLKIVGISSGKWGVF